MTLMPVGFVTAVFGLVGGAIYWLSSRGRLDRNQNGSAKAALQERYARGEIDDGEFRYRRDQLKQEG